MNIIEEVIPQENAFFTLNGKGKTSSFDAKPHLDQKAFSPLTVR